MTLTRSAQNGPGAARLIIRRTVGCVQRRAPARAVYQIRYRHTTRGTVRPHPRMETPQYSLHSPPVQCAAENEGRERERRVRKRWSHSTCRLNVTHASLFSCAGRTRCLLRALCCGTWMRRTRRLCADPRTRAVHRAMCATERWWRRVGACHRAARAGFA